MDDQSPKRATLRSFTQEELDRISGRPHRSGAARKAEILEDQIRLIRATRELEELTRPPAPKNRGGRPRISDWVMREWEKRRKAGKCLKDSDEAKFLAGLKPPKGCKPVEWHTIRRRISEAKRALRGTEKGETVS